MGAPATNSETIHVVNKADNRQHAVVNLDSSLDEELPVSALRARPILLGLTSNNLSYARGGDLLHWWETYPVPHTAPPPYNDQASWGIVPAWGYATVTESSVPGIAPDSVIWGYWPTSTSPTLLRLEPSDLQGHWVEVSSHRQQLMPIYNRYEQILPENEEPDEMAWGAVLRGVWIAGYLLSEYVYTTGEIQTARADMQSMGKIQFNASGVQDTLIDRDGAATYFGKISRSWKVWLADRDSAIPDMHLVRGQGIAGENGIYGGWERLTHGAVRPEEGLVYAL
ncbi:hypothetical protein KXW58_000515 [Aspergillus fumigatus]|nr:hypothetical protein KXW58_000515 [Aspergillus fumigatus]